MVSGDKLNDTIGRWMKDGIDARRKIYLIRQCATKIYEEFVTNDSYY